MSNNTKKLYELLPVLYRIRDAQIALQMQQAGTSASGSEGPLEALLGIIAEEVAAIEENLDQLYDDQFIETCAEWVVPYIGELVGARKLIHIPDANFSQRSEVANTIKYRRRKGTASVIEQLARDVTGWDANVVEYFQLLATTQYLNHLRPQNLAVSGVNDWRLLEYANTPFDKMPKTVDVRRIENRRGKYNIQNVGVFLWRLKSYSHKLSPPFEVDVDRFTFDLLRKDTLLYQLSVAESTITQLAGPMNVPMPISRRLLMEEFEAYYGVDKSLVLFINGDPLTPDVYNTYFNSLPNLQVTKLSEIMTACNLSDVYDNTGTLTGWANMPSEKIAIDPVLGRLAFPPSMLTVLANIELRLMYHYGFSAEMGGGEYERESSFVSGLAPVVQVQAGVLSIQAALDELPDSGGVIEITDNEYYFENLVISLADEATVEIRAQNGKRPTLVLSDYMQIHAGDNTQVHLNGLLISGGGIQLDALSRLESLVIEHCTFVPGACPAIGLVPAAPAAPRIIVGTFFPEIKILKSILGGLQVAEGASVKIEDSIIDATEQSLAAYEGTTANEAGGTLQVKNSTLIGRVHTILMEEASNTIFLAEEGGVLAERLQQGCIRFSYFPQNSRLPRAYRCQPELAGNPARIKPSFTSLTYGDPGYGQLSEHCVEEITKGADDEAEMGAFHQLYQSQKLSNLQARLDEYLRFGLEAGIFYAS